MGEPPSRLESSLPQRLAELSAENAALRQQLAERPAAPASAERYRLFFAHTRDLVLCVRHHDGRILDVNAAACRAYGYSEAELLALSIHDLRAPETYQDLEPQMANASVEGLLFRTVHRRKDGSTFPVEVNSVGLTLAGERLLLSSIRDITEQRRAEQVLRESESKFRLLFETTSEGVALHELIAGPAGHPLDYRIITVNPAFSRHTGFPAPEVCGRLASQTYGTGSPPFLEVYARVAQTGEATAFETYYPPLDKHFTISVFSPKPGWFATVFADITHRKAVENDRERLITELNAALAKVKTLRGLIPICAGCKKVRDDAGYWLSVERFLGDRSEAEFTHGICPDCALRLYPGIGRRRPRLRLPPKPRKQLGRDFPACASLRAGPS